MDEHHWLFIDDEREDLRYVYAMPASRNATDLAKVLHVRVFLSATPRLTFHCDACASVQPAPTRASRAHCLAKFSAHAPFWNCIGALRSS